MNDLGIDENRPFRSVGFLLSQLGASNSKRFQETMAPTGLEPRHFAVLRHLAAAEGVSQQAMADALQIPPSRMVSLIDELEDKGLVERRSHPSDRRARAIYVTDKGREAAASAMQLAMGHERAVCSSLTQAEREQLIELLLRVAASQGLQPGVHPDLARAEEMQPPHG